MAFVISLIFNRFQKKRFCMFVRMYFFRHSSSFVLKFEYLGMTFCHITYTYTASMYLSMLIYEFTYVYQLFSH